MTLSKKICALRGIESFGIRLRNFCCAIHCEWICDLAIDACWTPTTKQQLRNLSDLVGPIPPDVWGFFAFGVGVAVILGLFPHLRQVWHRWRLNRRLARDTYILRDELNEYNSAIGEELEPIDGWHLVRGAIVAGLMAGVPVWLADKHLDHWWEAALLAMAALSLLQALWRKLNDPEPGPAFLHPDISIPKEAAAGFAAAVGIVALLLLLAIKFL